MSSPQGPIAPTGPPLVQVSESAGPLGVAETSLLLENATGFIPLLRAHILKEDRILYPMAERLLTGPEFDAMETEFEAFERTMRVDGGYDRLSALAEKLLAAFRPDPGRMAQAAQMVGCGAGR
jgi:hypothetical protein